SLSRELPEQFQRNCAALLGTKVVLCDGAFLSDVGRCLQDPNISIHNKWKNPDMHEAALTLMYLKAESILNWIIGHEIGHIARRHNQEDVIQRGWRSPRATDGVVLGSQVEIDADEYALRSMFHGKDETTQRSIAFF